MTVSRLTSRGRRAIISFTTVTHFDGKVSRWSLIRVLLKCFGDHRVIKLPIYVTVVLLGNSLEVTAACWASRQTFYVEPDFFYVEPPYQSDL